MKKHFALSIVAPGGDLIRTGKKTLEIRRWQPDTLPMKDLLIVQNSVHLDSLGVTEDPNGKAVALVDIETVSVWQQDDLSASCSSCWEPGWLAWKITNVRPFDCDPPVPAKLRIYEIELSSAERT